MCSITVKLPALNEYTDLSEQYKIDCYSLNEIIAEKMRSLMQRTMPRDLYDLWYFLEKENKDILDYVSEFKDKAVFKGLIPEKFSDTVNQKELTFKKGWEKNLIMQIKDIPDFNSVWRELSRHFRKFDDYINH